MSAREWRSAAACRDVDPEVFFPTAESGPVYEAQVATAKQVCAGCPVRAECLDEALARIPDGVAGGLTSEERRALRGTRPAVRPRPVPAQRAAVSAAEVLEVGLRHGAGPEQVRAAGRVLLAAGRSQREVAQRCGVCPRTVARWAATTSATADAVGAGAGAGAGKDRGCCRVLPLISHANPLGGTRAEGHRA